MKTLNLLSVFFFVFALNVSSGFSEEKLWPCRHSADYSVFVIYQSKSIALMKKTLVQADGDHLGETETDFYLIRAHWAGSEPEQADVTGDIPGDNVASFPKRMGIDEDRKWLLVYGQELDATNLTRIDKVWLISLLSEKIYSAPDINALKLLVSQKSIELPQVQLEPVEIFFDRQLVYHLTHRV